jgi:hypothetical protein
MDTRTAAENPPSADEVQEHFGKIGLGSSARRARQLLMVGFTEGCDYFIDFSMLRFCQEIFKAEESLAFCLQLIIYFPSEYRMASAVSLELKSIRGMSYKTRFLLKQVDEIRVVRQASSSAGATRALKDSKDAIESVLVEHRTMLASDEVYYP